MMSILAAVDMTPESKLVLEAAAALAETLDAQVRLVHVVVPSAPFAPMVGMIPATGVDSVPGLVQRARDRLAAMERELPAGRNGGIDVEVGPAADTLLRLASEEEVDLLVLGVHDHGSVARALGTTAAHIVNRSRAPVLVVRRRGKGDGVGHAPLRFVAAVDSSDTAGAVVARAVELARAPGARIRLVRVEAYLDQADATHVPTVGGAAEELRRLKAAIPPERRDGATIVRGHTAPAICSFAEEYDADIVVIGAHAYGWTERLLGTTAAAVVDTIDRPLLVVRRASRDHSRVDLRARYARLERACQSLIDAFGAGEWPNVQAEWAVFEPSIRAHLAFAEQVFAAPSSAYPGDAAVLEADAMLEAEHGGLREQIDRFAVAIELHSVVERDAEELMKNIRRHAAREEDVFVRSLDRSPAAPA